MIAKYILLLSFIVVGVSYAMCAEQDAKRVSLCSIQSNPESFLHAHVEVRASIFIGARGQLEDGKCSFLFAFGDDYQTLGRRSDVKHDHQWALMMKHLRTPPPSNCSVNARIVRANIKGIVERIPATGTIPEAEMGLQVVILSVSGVEPVPIKCDPPNARFSEPLVHQNGRANLRELADEVDATGDVGFGSLQAGLTYDWNGSSL